jgi:hypothetical protein
LPRHPQRPLHCNWPLQPWNHHHDASSATMRISAQRANLVWTHVQWQRRTTTPTVKMEFLSSAGKMNVGPTCGFTVSHEVGQRATINTLQIGYPRVHASSKDQGQGMRPCTATCPVTPDPASPPRRAPALPRDPQHWAPPLRPRGLQRCQASLSIGPRLFI